MKNKFITITVIVSSIIVAVALVFVLVGLTKNNTPNIEENNNDNKNNVENNESNLPNDRYENILVSSKFGQEIINMFNVSNVYSKAFANELQVNGLNDKAKRIFAYMKIATDEKYTNLHRVSEENMGYYFLSSDLQNVVNEYFYNSNNVQHGVITQDYTYDSTSGNYVVVPMGFGGSDFDFVIEVPYEIREYSDRLEVYMYRLYVESKLDLQDNVENVRENIYYDIDKKEKAFDVESGTLSYEENQVEIISEYISSQKLEKNKLFKIKYEFKKESEKYLISTYEEIK